MPPGRNRNPGGRPDRAPFPVQEPGFLPAPGLLLPPIHVLSPADLQTHRRMHRKSVQKWKCRLFPLRFPEATGNGCPHPPDSVPVPLLPVLVYFLQLPDFPVQHLKLVFHLRDTFQKEAVPAGTVCILLHGRTGFLPEILQGLQNFLIFLLPAHLFIRLPVLPGLPACSFPSPRHSAS